MLLEQFYEMIFLQVNKHVVFPCRQGSTSISELPS